MGNASPTNNLGYPGQTHRSSPSGEHIWNNTLKVRDARKAPPQLYGSRQLAAGLVGLSDGGSVGFGDDIHGDVGGVPVDRREALQRRSRNAAAREQARRIAAWTPLPARPERQG
jgi:hypothetical protein